MDCKICKQNIKNYITLGLHLKNEHNISSKEYYDKFLIKKGEGFCVTCGSPTTFDGIRLGYRTHCGCRCAQLDENTRNKFKSTCLKLYGAENPYASDEIKEKIKQSNLKNLGVEYPQQHKEVRKKSSQTKQIKYGDKNYNNTEKAKETCLNNWGVSSYSKTKQFYKTLLSKVDFSKTSQKGLLTKVKGVQKMVQQGYIPIQELFKQYGESWYKNKVVPIEFYFGTAFVSPSNVKIIDDYFHYNSSHSSQEEYQIYSLLKKYYQGEIIHSDYKTLKGFELDFYLPQMKLAFEYNGVYWHSTKHKDKNYHFNKSILCLQKGIRLVHIYAFENINDIEQFIKTLFEGKEHPTTNFDKYSPLQFNQSVKYFSGPQIIYNSKNETVYGSGTFTLI